jgi:hypothetical protein
MKRPKFVWAPNKQTRRARLLRFYPNDEDMQWYNLRLRKMVEMFRPEWAPDNPVNGDEQGGGYFVCGESRPSHAD